MVFLITIHIHDATEDYLDDSQFMAEQDYFVLFPFFGEQKFPNFLFSKSPKLSRKPYYQINVYGKKRLLKRLLSQSNGKKRKLKQHTKNLY